MNESINYSKLILPENSNEEDQRALLLTKLKKGVAISLLNESISFTSEHESLGLTDHLSICIYQGEQKIAEVDALFTPETSTARGLGKYYEPDISEKFRKIGLIVNATSLLYEVLKDKGVNKAVGMVSTSNIESILNRLKVQDFFTKKYFPVTIEKESDEARFKRIGRVTKESYYIVTTDLSREGFLDEPMTIEEALIK